MSSLGEQRIQAQPQRHIVFLCVPPLIELDLIGPLSVFEQAARPKVGDSAGTPGHRRYRITLATAGEDLAMAGDCGVTLIAHRHYSDVTEPIDTLIVATGCVNTDIDPELRDWLRSTAKKTRRMCSICVGAFVFAAAGLLNERRAATHWSFADALQTRYPQVQVDSEPIWVKDGYMYTSAGMSAGIDLALALVEEDLGSSIALQLARLLVVFLKRPAGQRQFSVPLRAQSSNTKIFADLVVWISENVSKPLPVELLAERVAMSPRNFARVFRAEIGVTPAAYVRRVRIEAARAILEESPRRLSDIAERCGFGSEEVMRRAFLDDLGVTPGQYRSTFGTGRLQHR